VLPAFRDEVPYAVVLVELDEDPGLRLLGNLRACAPAEIQAQMPVEVVFEDAATDVTLAHWRPAAPPR
jgi:hypothetical protein